MNSINTGPAHPLPQSGSREVLLRFKDSSATLSDLGLEPVETFHFSAPGKKADSSPPIQRVQIPAHLSMEKTLEMLRTNEGIDFAEPNRALQLESPLVTPIEQSGKLVDGPPGKKPDDLDFRQWSLYNNGRRNGKAGADVAASKAWETTVGHAEEGPLIAVIDTGIDYEHPDLAANVWVNPGEIPGDGVDNDGNGVVDDVHGFNALDRTGDPMDDHSHGTHCAGIIGAAGNNGIGITGLNWRARMMGVKIFDSRGNTTLHTILRGLEYAHEMGARITNNSWGDFESSEALKHAFASMDSTVHFAAAGNKRNNNDYRNYFPAGHDLPNMVAVAASDRSDKLPTFSNYGRKTVDLAAPGDQIISTVKDSSLGVYSGTSMAAPHAAGAAALILHQFPQASPLEVKERLIYNSDPVPALSAASRSGGRINAHLSLEDDQVAPATGEDFRITRADSQGVKLAWTVTGDDGWCDGPPAGVELWVSPEPVTADKLGKAKKLDLEKPARTGQVMSFHLPLEHCNKNREFHFALRMVDNVGNRSPLTTAGAVVPAAREIYSSTFGPSDGYRGEDKWARLRDENGEWYWSDSPEGNSQHGADSSLISPPISLAGKAQCRLSLDTRHEFWKRDRAGVEVSTDGGKWESLGSYHGRSRNWTTRHFDLSDYDGKTVQIRVRVETDLRHSKDGIDVKALRIMADEA